MICPIFQLANGGARICQPGCVWLQSPGNILSRDSPNEGAAYKRSENGGRDKRGFSRSHSPASGQEQAWGEGSRGTEWISDEP